MKFLVVLRQPVMSATEASYATGSAEEIRVSGVGAISCGPSGVLTVFGDGGGVVALFAPGEWSYVMAADDTYGE